MNRGIFDVFKEDKGYQGSTKEWLVELQHTKMYWYELLVNGHKEVDTRKHIFEQVKTLKEQVESELEKRFVYFICSRKKVRFCTQTPPVPTPFFGYMKIRVLIGREEAPKEFVVSALYDEHQELILPIVDDSGKFITFTFFDGQKLSFSIHDYLLEFEVNLGLSTKVEYVGKTKNPNSRPLNGVHGGLNDVLYNVSTDDNDILIFINVFKVISRAKNVKNNIVYNVSNSMIDEVKVEQEGEVIEKAFRFYFDSDTQIRHRNIERREIINDLRQMSKESNIKCMHVFFEVDENSEYYSFYSTNIAPKHEHYFSVSLVEEDIEVCNLNSSLEDFAMQILGFGA